MKHLLAFGFAILLSIPAFAATGGSSTVGVGAPEFRYICKDASSTTSVRILRFWPKYDVDHISISNSTGVTPKLNEAATATSTETLLTFTGARSRFVLDLTSRELRNDQTIILGRLTVVGLEGEKQYECVDRTSK